MDNELMDLHLHHIFDEKKDEYDFSDFCMYFIPVNPPFFDSRSHSTSSYASFSRFVHTLPSSKVLSFNLGLGKSLQFFRRRTDFRTRVADGALIWLSDEMEKMNLFSWILNLVADDFVETIISYSCLRTIVVGTFSSHL
jgi:hypothetical protein